jgi:hypothetical protein
MILKILLTLAVFIAVYIWFRTQNSKRLDSNTTLAARSVTVDARKNNWIKPFSYSMAALTLAAGILFYYLSWQENHTQYQVTITNPQTGTSETFIALKKDMRGRLFITQSGREIRVSDLERIEVKKLATENH